MNEPKLRLTRWAAMLCLAAQQVSAAVFPETQRVELTPDEVASLSDPPPEWFDELPLEEREENVIRRGDEDIVVVLDDDGQAAGFTGTKWSGGNVYYQFNANVNGTNQQRFRDAAAQWSAVAKLTFFEGTGSGDYIEVRSDTSNSSYVGRVGGKQILRIVSWTSKFIIAHEIAHALGVSHEHSRSDRDSYVSIISENIEDGKEHNFDKRSSTNYGSYDFDSVMHYRRNAFLKAGLSSSSNTIEPKPAYSNQLNAMGQRTHLSVLDKQGMVDHYGGVVTSPDLADRGASFRGLSNTSLSPGDSLTVRGDVANFGSSSAGGFSVDFYASTNTTISTSDQYLGRKVFLGLSGRSFTALDTTVVLPAAMPDGTYYVGWILDASFSVVEGDESNNTVYISSPQLTVAAVSVDLKDDGTAYQSLSSTTVQAGTPVSVFGDIRNGGNSASGNFETKVYLSTNTIISASDTLLGTVSTSSIAGGGWANMDLLSANVPVDLTPGDYYVGWIIDPSDAVRESDESNNNVLYAGGNTRLTVTAPPLPQIDLVQEDPATVPDPLTVGDSFTFASNVRNDGSAASGSFSIAFYLSADTSIDQGADVLIGTAAIPSITGGATHAYSAQLMVPASQSPGTYYVGWVIDSGNVVNETDEGNNIWYLTASRSVQVPTGSIDLKDDGEQWQKLGATTVGLGDTLTINCDIRNGGTLPSGAFDVDFYLSTNDIISSTDHLLGSVMVGSIDAGGWDNADLTDVTISNNLAAGAYYVGWIIDPGDVVLESDESNNKILYHSGTQQLTVTVPPSTVELLDDGEDYQSISATSVFAGGAVTVRCDVRNTGSAAAGSYKVKFYLSTNTNITASDNLIGTVPVSDHPATSWLDVDLVDAVIPVGFASGDYYVGWIIDADFEVTESDESNNAIALHSGDTKLTVAGTVTDVDLHDEGDQLHNVSSQSIPLGGRFSTNFGIRNSGNLASPSFDIALYLSTNTTISTADRHLGTQRVSSIPGKGFRSIVFSNVQIPPDLAVRDYHLGWIIDAGSEIGETDEGNNRGLFKSGTQALSITPAGSRFAITAFRCLPNHHEFEFVTVAGKSYRVSTSTDLDTWVPVAGHSGIPGTGTTITRTITHSALPHHASRYFRVEEE